METNLRGRRPAAHGGTVVCANLRTSEGVGEHVKGDVVGVRPNSQLWVIGKLGTAVVKRIPVVCSRSVRCRRNGDTLQVRCCSAGELRKDPAIIGLVVFNDDIPFVVRLTPTAEPAPERIPSYRTK